MSRLLSLLSCLLGTTLLTPAPPAPLPPDVREKVDEVFKTFTTSPSPGCAVAIYRNGEIAYARGYGLASLEHSVPITPRTVFDIGSTSKQFTAFSILLLEREGRLSLDDDVRKFVAELPQYQRPITIRHLLQHTSGLRDYLTLFSLAGVKTESWTTQRDAVRLAVRQREANFAAGDEWLYSNTGYLLLAEVVQRASGESLKDFARARIFEPLGMARTFILDNHTLVVANRATGYGPRTGGFQVDMSNFEQVGDGAVQTTVEDLLLWDRNFYEPRVGDAPLIECAQQTGTLTGGRALDYAAGLMIGEYRGLRTVRHGGAWAGYRADLVRFPTERTSIACFCNLSSANPGRLADRVADVVLAGVLKPAAPTAVRAAASPFTIPEAELRRLEGVYRSADGRAFGRVRVSEGKATWRGRIPLVPIAPRRFLMGGAGAEVVCAEGSGGRQQCQVQPPPGSRGDPVTFEQLPAVAGADDLRAYAGDYYADELDVVWTFTVKDDALVLSIRGDTGEPFVRADRDTFIQDNGLVVEFAREGGVVSGGRLHAGRVRNLRFKRAS